MRIGNQVQSNDCHRIRLNKMMISIRLKNSISSNPFLNKIKGNIINKTLLNPKLAIYFYTHKLCNLPNRIRK